MSRICAALSQPCTSVLTCCATEAVPSLAIAVGGCGWACSLSPGTGVITTRVAAEPRVQRVPRQNEAQPHRRRHTSSRSSSMLSSSSSAANARWPRRPPPWLKLRSEPLMRERQ